jgi:hypothetical protein
MAAAGGDDVSKWVRILRLKQSTFPDEKISFAVTRQALFGKGCGLSGRSGVARKHGAQLVRHARRDSQALLAEEVCDGADDS